MSLPLGRFITGVSFGLLLEKAKVYLPTTIISQFGIPPSLTMLRMFLFATSSGLLVISILETVGIYQRCHRPSTALGFGLVKGYGGNVAGGMILGAGMALSGACPGTVLLQIGAGIQNGLVIFSGCLVGSLLLGIASTIFSKTKFRTSKPSKVVDHALEIPYVVVASSVSLLIIALALKLNDYSPWQENLVSVSKEFRKVSSWPISLYDLVWDPMVSGSLMGMVQLMSILFTAGPIGNSSAYDSIVSFFVNPAMGDRLPYFTKTSFSDLLQKLLFPIGVVAGSFLSLTLSGGMGTVQSVPVPTSTTEAFVGGILILFGARMAKGCTSGHGISGMAELSVASIATSAMMFAAAFLFSALYRQ